MLQSCLLKIVFFLVIFWFVFCFVLFSSNKTSLLLTPFTDEEDSNSKGDESAKKRRVETFRQKEKRKRDMGQATSDKNFVEEEKRILRENDD